MTVTGQSTYVCARPMLIVHHSRRLAFYCSGNFEQHFSDYFDLTILGSHVKSGQTGLQNNKQMVMYLDNANFVIYSCFQLSLVEPQPK